MADGALGSRILVQSKDEIGELAGAFNFMAEQVQELIHAQRNFVSNAAHELRTPIMSARLRIEALQQGSLDAEQQTAYLRELGQEVDHMAGLVTSLLVLARLDEGRHPGKNEPYDAAALLQDISRNWRIQAQKSGLAFHAEIPSDLPDVSMSASDLRIVIDNLLSNAVKYTRQGQITVSAWRNDRSICLAVTDTGVGFEPDGAERLFERFYRGNQAGVQRVSGTGLGLSIVQAILTYYRGQIQARSSGPGQGATFEVEIPI
jgi:signal transduction histidine kinase